MFPNKEWTLNGLKILLRKVDATGDVEDHSGSGRPRTTCVPDVIDDVQDMVLGQETNHNRTAVKGRLLVKQAFNCCQTTELFTKICV